MTDLRNLPKEFILEFIHIYKSFPCIWKIKSKEYKDRNARNIAYEILTNKLREMIPDATKDTVVKKIDSLRGNFRKEYKKVTNLGKFNSDNADIYKPTLWYYEKMLFLKNQEIPCRSISAMKIEKRLLEEEEGSSSSSEYLFGSQEPSISSTPIPQSSNKRKRRDSDEEVLLKVQQRSNERTSDDEFDIIGKNIAFKLRKLPNDVKVTTEKLIMDIMYQAELGYISSATTITINNLK